jgi:hypothetical protein
MSLESIAYAVELRLSVAVVTGYIDPGKPMSPVP